MPTTATYENNSAVGSQASEEDPNQSDDEDML
jgi:hypothetical protein